MLFLMRYFYRHLCHSFQHMITAPYLAYLPFRGLPQLDKIIEVVKNCTKWRVGPHFRKIIWVKNASSGCCTTQQTEISMLHHFLSPSDTDTSSVTGSPLD